MDKVGFVVDVAISILSFLITLFLYTKSFLRSLLLTDLEIMGQKKAEIRLLFLGIGTFIPVVMDTFAVFLALFAMLKRDVALQKFVNNLRFSLSGLKIADFTPSR